MYYTYSIKNLENGKLYIGSRTNKCMLTRKPEDDLGIKYFSSSKDKELRQAIKDGKVKYTILQEYDDPQVCWRAEQQLIALYWKFFGKDMSYNHFYRNYNNENKFNTIGIEIHHSEFTKNLIKAKKKEYYKNHDIWNKGKKDIYSEETIRKISEGHKGKTAWNKGISRNDESIKKQVKSLKKYYETHDAPNKGKVLTLNQKENISTCTKKAMNNPILKQKCAWATGTKWMNNGIASKQVKSIDFDYYLSIGWQFGKIKKQYNNE